MSTVKALILDPTTSEVTLRNIPKPTPATGEVLIRVRAIALNPVDGLFIAHPIATSDRVIGLDFAGVVEGAASDLETSTDKRTQTGARVAGFLQGGEYRSSTYVSFSTLTGPSLLGQLPPRRVCRVHYGALRLDLERSR